METSTTSILRDGRGVVYYGFWLLVAGFWFLVSVSRFWFLVSGFCFWFLVSRFSFLVSRFSFLVSDALDASGDSCVSRAHLCRGLIPLVVSAEILWF
jgi:hypothetical protein